jgi:hypothetical protein
MRIGVFDHSVSSTALSKSNLILVKGMGGTLGTLCTDIRPTPREKDR